MVVSQVIAGDNRRFLLSGPNFDRLFRTKAQKRSPFRYDVLNLRIEGQGMLDAGSICKCSEVLSDKTTVLTTGPEPFITTVW